VVKKTEKMSHFKRIGYLMPLIFVLSCNNPDIIQYEKAPSAFNKMEYDMRDGLIPSRLTIAMWD
jgi:hypothetical protein